MVAHRFWSLRYGFKSRRDLKIRSCDSCGRMTRRTGGSELKESTSKKRNGPRLACPCPTAGAYKHWYGLASYTRGQRFESFPPDCPPGVTD